MLPLTEGPIIMSFKAIKERFRISCDHGPGQAKIILLLGKKLFWEC